MMGQQELPTRKSWLSLVAETAGVPGATIARIEISCFNQSYGRAVTAIVQVQDEQGRVVGASTWEGDPRLLAAGVEIDVGCDLGAAWGSRVVAWIDPGPVSRNPSRALPPSTASARYFDPMRSMKLMLHHPERPAALTTAEVEAA